MKTKPIEEEEVNHMKPKELKEEKEPGNGCANHEEHTLLGYCDNCYSYSYCHICGNCGNCDYKLNLGK